MSFNEGNTQIYTDTDIQIYRYTDIQIQIHSGYTQMNIFQFFRANFFLHGGNFGPTEMRA